MWLHQKKLNPNLKSETLAQFRICTGRPVCTVKNLTFARTEPFPSRFPTKNFCLRCSVCFKGVGLNTPHLAGSKKPHLQLAWPVCKASGSCPRTHLAPSHWPPTAKWQLRRETRERENKWKFKKKKKSTTRGERDAESADAVIQDQARYLEANVGTQPGEARCWYVTSCIIFTHLSVACWLFSSDTMQVLACPRRLGAAGFNLAKAEQKLLRMTGLRRDGEKTKNNQKKFWFFLP